MNGLMQRYSFLVFMAFFTNSKSLVISDCIPDVEESVGDYDVTCGYDAPGYYNLIIDCHQHHLSNLNNVKTNLHFVSKIAFLNCTFTRTANVQSLVRLLNISYKTITFKYFDKNINRLNFQNLSTPELYLIRNNVSELPFDLFHDVLNVGSLTIVFTNVDRVPKAFFSDWAENLLELDLSYNKLRKIARYDFAHLVNVVSLNLGRNRIDEIESGAFDNLSRLESLDLSSNQFHALPSNIFHCLRALNMIELSFYPRLEDKMEPTDAKNLTMIQLKSLASDLFKGTSKLHIILLMGHNLQELPLGIFDDNKYLEMLNLVRNKLEYLPAGIFKKLMNLKTLVLTKNRLTTLVPDAFMGLDSLQTLRVSENNLTRIDTHLLMQLNSLRHIDFSFNQITAIQHLDEENLNFQNSFLHMNRFTNATDIHFPDIMNLSFNSFTEFNVDFVNVMAKNQIIDLRNNCISNVNLSGLSSRRLNVDFYGEIEYVHVYLGNNPLHCDCHLMDFINYLNGSSNRDLQKSRIIFTQDESTFGKKLKCSSPPELKYRDVRKIHLEEFRCRLQSTTVDDACNETCFCQEYPGIHVLTVDCSYRNLNRLPLMISNVHNWSIELNMTGNALTYTPSLNHSYLIAVTKLDLSNNNITKVSIDTFSPALQELKLHNNSISRLDRSVIEYLSLDNSLSSLTIHENKWICDCETYKFLRSLNREKVSSYNFNKISCYGTSRAISEIAENEVCEDTEIFIIVASSMIAFFGILVGCLAALYYRYQKQIKIWLYSRHWCLRFITDDELDRDKKYDAFISFSHKDEDFVEKEIIAKLEEGPRPYKLCLHYRDWLAGEWIPLQISRSVADSRRTIIILTPNFLESVWGLVEFRTAHTQALEEGRSRLIVVIQGEIGNLDNLDQELKEYLRLNTYIKWGDPWFWQKLKYALPHRFRSL